MVDETKEDSTVTENDIPVISGGLRGDDMIIALDEKGRYLIERDGKRVIVDRWMIEPAEDRSDEL